MTKIVLTTATFAIAIAAMATNSARADGNAPFCATAYGLGGSAGTSCDFYTFAQCQASISGTGGTCSTNPNARESLARAPRSR